MKVQCVLCDQIEEIDPDNIIGKKLRNRPLATFLCQTCYQRITELTQKSRVSGKITNYISPATDDW